MPKHDSKYTIGFVCIISVCCSLVLAVAATSLKKRQDANQALDIKKNILKAFGEYDPDNPISSEEVTTFFETRIEGIVLDHEGNVVEQKVEEGGEDQKGEAKKPVTADSIKPLEQEKKKLEERLYPLYVYKDKSGKTAGYSMPIIGKGLWSTMYGYLALEADANTVLGITFYKHGETPGLGGEIEADWFQKQFEGKKVLDQSGELVAVSLVKGSAAELYSDNPEKLSHHVDGMSGATITSNGVTEMLKDDLSKYEPYFDRVRQGGQ